ncbi:MAG: AbrB/MazE/SpoVT family DNA-binding domain-containing protein [Planctomycetes bacterium]|nr:AbrB/MazE/SpoVT family DNA-binding domain-containing protein [Planctomycetota bacterium]
MPTMRIRPKHQITIPKEVSEKLHLHVGDLVEAIVENGNIVLIPKQLTNKHSIPSLNKNEHKILIEAREKIKKIQTDLLHSKGLNDYEIKVAVKARLINADQAWWWHEDWQKGEREAEENIKNGKLAGPFDNIEDLVKSLKS